MSASCGHKTLPINQSIEVGRLLDLSVLLYEAAHGELKVGEWRRLIRSRVLMAGGGGAMGEVFSSRGRYAGLILSIEITSVLPHTEAVTVFSVPPGRG